MHRIAQHGIARHSMALHGMTLHCVRCRIGLSVTKSSEQKTWNASRTSDIIDVMMEFREVRLSFVLL